MKKIDKIKEVNLEAFEEFEYQNFKLIDMYSDYGDITGIQTIRRFIQHCNKHFGALNESIKQFIILYTDLEDMISEHEAFIQAWNEMIEKNDKFVQEVKDLLEAWIDDPRVQKWITDRLDKMINEELPKKLDKSVFEAFEKEMTIKLKEIDTRIDGVAKDLLSKLNEKEFSDFIKEYEKNKDLPLDIDVFDVERKDRQGNYENATVKVIHIPFKNSDGSINMPIPEYYPNRKTIEDNKGEDKMLVFNGGYGMGRHGDGIEGRNLINGKIINDVPSRTENYYTLAWNMKGDMTMLPSSIDCNGLLKMGYTEAVSGYRFIIRNHQVQYWDTDEKSQRMALARMENKDFLLIMAGARSNKEVGLTIPSLAEEIKNRYNPKEMYMLDGGGSAQAKLNEQNLMPFGDSSSTINFSEYRGIFSHMYFKRPNKLTPFQKHSYDVLGKINSLLLNEITPFMFTRSTTDLNLAKETGFYWARPSTSNKPGDYVGSVLAIKNEALNTTQIFFQNLTKSGIGKHGVYMRTWVESSGYWSDWLLIGGETMYPEILDMDKVITAGKYYAPGSTANAPDGFSAGFLEVWVNAYNTPTVMQTVIPTAPNNNLLMARRRGSLKDGVVDWERWRSFKVE